MTDINIYVDGGTARVAHDRGYGATHTGGFFSGTPTASTDSNVKVWVKPVSGTFWLQLIKPDNSVWTSTGQSGSSSGVYTFVVPGTQLGQTGEHLLELGEDSMCMNVICSKLFTL